MSQDLYQLIHPEHRDIEHDLQLYYGLQEIGASRLEDALEGGFLRIHGAEGEEVFVHESELPKLRALIEEVEGLRRAQQPEDPRVERARQRARLWLELRPKLELAGEEREALEALYFSLPLEQWSEAHLLQLRDAHRRSQQLLAQGQSDEGAACPCRPCTEARGLLLRQRRKELAIEWGQRLQQVWESLDFRGLADSSLGHERALPQEVLLRHAYEALWEAAQEEPWQPETAVARAQKQLEMEFEALREEGLQRQRAQQRLEDLRQWLSASFMPRWRRQERSWRVRFRDSPLGKESFSRIQLCQLFDHHRDALQHARELYTGEQPLSSFQQQLEALAEQRRKELEAWFDALQRRHEIKENPILRAGYASYFPVTRQLKRKLYFFCGPTNSGKTYQAFEALASCDSGVYLAPLRLLALEGQRALLDRGLRTSFLTGEERDIRKGARFVSSTIEMLRPQKILGGAILDEIQMLAHPQRGWAWTQALVGVPAHQVWMTGSPDVLPAVQKIAAHLQEPLEVRHFQRFNRLEICPEPARLDALQPATAIVCFSRRDVLRLKREIEDQSAHQVAVVYGALSPEVRRQEARRFRRKQAQILVATDAIGMGLNLPIRTILFWSLEKTSQGITRSLTPSEILQIAGRAGRYGQEEQGFVGAFDDAALGRVARVLDAELPEFEGPCPVMPHPSHLESLAEALQTESLPELLRIFRTQSRLEPALFFPKVTDSMEALARHLQEPLTGQPLKVQFTFARAPISIQSRELLDEIYDLAERFGRGEPLSIPVEFLTPFLQPATEEDGLLRKAERHVTRLTLYRWLAYQFPERFEQADDADVYRHILNRFIGRSLSRGGLHRCCPRCGAQMPLSSRFRTCHTCHKEQKRR